MPPQRGIPLRKSFGVLTASIFFTILTALSLLPGTLQGQPPKLLQLRILETRQLSDEFVSSGHRDANGDIAAGLKIVSDLDGLSYEANNGIVGRVERKLGADMVFVQPSERVLTIYKTGYQPLQVILSEHDIRLKSRQVWEIRLTAEQRPLGIVILSEPPDAEKILDGESLGTGESFQVTPGQHELMLRKAGFRDKTVTIRVAAGQTLFKDLILDEMELAQVRIRSTPDKATVFIDGVDKGLTDLGLWLYPGSYQLRLVRSGYLDVTTQITVLEGRTNDFHSDLTKNVGTLSVTVTPADARVFINKEDYGDRRKIELAPGTYRVAVEKSGWHGQSEQVTVGLGETVKRTYTLKQITGSLRFTVKPLEARVTLYGSDGAEVESWTGMKYLQALPVGTYRLEAGQAGYETQKIALTITENHTSTTNLVLEEGSDIVVAMVLVEGGSFQMGSTSGDSDEKPVHTVTVNSFYMDKTEVTQAEYRRVMGKNPSRFSDCDECPVEKVSWYEAIAYCNRRSGLEGLQPAYIISGETVTWDRRANGYRLPTEAEWEYAARGGNKSEGYTYSGSNGLAAVGWYTGNSGGRTHPVGQLQPNELGLYDMSGNVWEWGWDWYYAGYYRSSPKDNPTGPSTGSLRVVRGGSWGGDPRFCRVGDRGGGPPSDGDYGMGFRVCISAR